MSLVLHDTMAGHKRPFVPADPQRVTMYVCGPTVYNPVHIGTARPVVVFDLLYRLLRSLYGETAVVYARNVTDVDDKINQKAADEGVPIGAITDRFTAAYHADMAALGALTPNIEPRATAHIAAMLDMIGRLVDAGAAYPAEGHVLFDTTAFADYGKLSKRSLDDMIAGARVEVAPYKRNAADFVLWKPSKPGEPVWESPWGPGRPGWHIECSAMIEKNLGLPIDIHGGGHDLIFPHHENELAQGRCANHGGAFANYWVHNGFLAMDGEKMSKSLGNVLLVHDLVKSVPGETIRWALLSAHYRAPLDWDDTVIERAGKALNTLYQTLLDADRQAPRGAEAALPEALVVRAADEAFEEAKAALFDDLNTPRAFAALFKLSGLLRADLGLNDRARTAYVRDRLIEAGAMIGLLQVEPRAWFQGAVDPEFAARIEGLIKSRFEARQAKDWAAADRIRDELNALNVVVMDNADGATWRLKDRRILVRRWL